MRTRNVSFSRTHVHFWVLLCHTHTHTWKAFFIIPFDLSVHLVAEGTTVKNIYNNNILFEFYPNCLCIYLCVHFDQVSSFQVVRLFFISVFRFYFWLKTTVFNECGRLWFLFFRSRSRINATIHSLNALIFVFVEQSIYIIYFILLYSICLDYRYLSKCALLINVSREFILMRSIFSFGSAFRVQFCEFFEDDDNANIYT